MSPGLTRKLLAVHRWASLIVSVNFIVLALTGLILVFHEEIDIATGVAPEPRPADNGQFTSLSLAQTLHLAQDANPELHPIFATQRKENPGVVLFGFAGGNEYARATKVVGVDRDRGKLLPKADFTSSFTFFVLRLHAELLTGPPGRLVLGVIGLAILVSILTGIAVYGPTMRRFSFGLLRLDKSARAFLADLHKLIGAATFAWQFIVAATGVILCLAVVMFQGFARSELQELAAPYAADPTVTDVSAIDAAVSGAEAAQPMRQWEHVLFPGTALATKRHFSVLLEGGDGFESHMLGVVIVDALDPSDVQVVELPTYLKAMFISEPLHFGDYGGLPLKLLWSAFTLASLALCVSGVWTFCSSRFKKRRLNRAVASRSEREPGTA